MSVWIVDVTRHVADQSFEIAALNVVQLVEFLAQRAGALFVDPSESPDLPIVQPDAPTVRPDHFLSSSDFGPFHVLTHARSVSAFAAAYGFGPLRRR